MSTIPLSPLDAALELASTADVDALAAMLRSPDEATLHAALLECSWRAPGHDDRAIGNALGRPRADLSPEGRLLQVEVTSARSLSAPTLPSWRSWGLDATIAARWGALELARDPDGWIARALDEPSGEAALAMLTHKSIDLISANNDLPSQLILSGRVPCVQAGLALLESGLASGVLPLERACEALEAGLGSDEDLFVRMTLAQACKPWAVHAWRGDAARATLHRLARHEDVRVASRAVRVLTDRRERDILSLLARDTSCDLEVRRRALSGLGRCPDTTREDASMILSVGLEAPEVLGHAALDALGYMHRRGAFIEDAHVEEILTLFDAQDIQPAVVAGLLYTSRAEAVRALMALPHDDSRWQRRVHLLAVLPGSGDALLELAASEAPVAAAALALAGRARADGAEELAIARLEQHTRDALGALRHAGGQRACDVLARGLGLDTPEGSTAAYLRPHQVEATELVWHLDDARRWRDVLLARLNPARLPEKIKRDLGARISDAELELLTRADADPERTLIALCAHGGSECHDAIAELLRRVIDATAARALEPIPDPYGGAPRLAETTLSEELVDALRGYGARLFGRGALRPRALTYTSNYEDARRRVSNGLLLQTLSMREDPHPEVLRVTIDALDGRLEPDEIQLLLGALRHEDPHVRKVTLRALAQCRDDLGLTVRFVAALGADDIQTVRAAVEALGARARHVPLDLIVGALDHPNMNIKRIAAAALSNEVNAGSFAPHVVEKIMFWLGRHDHQEFRAALLRALRVALGDGTRAILIDAREAARRAGDTRRGDLLDVAIQQTDGKPGRWSQAERDVHTPRHVLTRIEEVAGRATPSVKLALARRARSVETPLLADAPLRLLALRACGAHVTLDDLLTCVEDADRAEDPDATLERTLALQFEGSRVPKKTIMRHSRRIVGATGERRRAALVELWRADIEHMESMHTGRRSPRKHMTVEAIWEALEARALPEDRARAIDAALALPWAPALHAAALRAHVLEGSEASATKLSRVVPSGGEEDLDAILGALEDPSQIQRMIAVAAHSRRLTGWLIDVWASSAPPTSELAQVALQRRDVEELLARTQDAIASGEHGLVELLTGGLIEGPETDALLTLLEGRQREHVARLARPGAILTEAARAERRRAADVEPQLDWKPATMGAKREEALYVLGSPDVFEVLGALRVLGNHRDPEVEAAVFDLMGHADSRVRDAARRVLRRVGSRATYLEATASQLDDPRPDTRRSIMRALAYAGYEAAAPAMVEAALDSNHSGLRKGARQALQTLGAPGVEAIEAAMRRARPDVRRRLEALRDDVFPDHA